MNIMKKYGYAASFFLMILFFVSAPGCVPTKTAIIRCQDVPIPSYEKRDYEKLLSSENLEVRYNAICNLIPYADTYADTIAMGSSRGPSGNMVDAAAYKQAQEVFAAVRNGLQGRSEDIKAASLIFIGDFSSRYSDKNTLITLVSRVNTHDTRTQYEQLRALIGLVDAGTTVDTMLIDNYLNSRSWLIRSMTYRLLGKIDCEEQHHRLVADYGDATREYDKLLIIEAFQQQYGAEVFELLKHEVIVSENPRIRMACADIFIGNKDEKAVSQWIIDNHQSIREDVLERIIDQYASKLYNEKGSEFFTAIITGGHPQLTALILQSSFFEILYNKAEKEDDSDRLITLRKTVQQTDPMRRAWETYVNERHTKENALKKKQELEKLILPEYTKRLELFLKDTQKLLAKFGMCPEEIDETTEDTRELLQLFKKPDQEITE